MERKKKIVVVDDDFDSLEIIRQILESAGYEAHCFLEAVEALEKIGEIKPDLVITDLMMKTIDTGYTFARQLKHDPRFPQLPIILVTAAWTRRGLSLRPRSDEELPRLGVDAYFDKPVVAEKLLAKIHELLEPKGKEKE